MLRYKHAVANHQLLLARLELNFFLGGRRLIHCATGATNAKIKNAQVSPRAVGHVGSSPTCALWTNHLFRARSEIVTPGRTRTYNPRLRRLMPYPLGHGARCRCFTYIYLRVKACAEKDFLKSKNVSRHEGTLWPSGQGVGLIRPHGFESHRRRHGWDGFLQNGVCFAESFFALSWVQSQSSPLGQILWAPAHSMSELVPKATTKKKKNGPQNHLTPSPRARPISKVPDLNDAIVCQSKLKATRVRNWTPEVSRLKWWTTFMFLRVSVLTSLTYHHHSPGFKPLARDR